MRKRKQSRRLYSSDDYPLVQTDFGLSHLRRRLASKRNRKRAMPEVFQGPIIVFDASDTGEKH